MGHRKFKDHEIHYNEITRPYVVSSAVVREPCIFRSLIIYSDGTNDVVFTIYDNAVYATGRVLNPPGFLILGTTRTFIYSPGPILCLNGVYVLVVTDGTTSYQVVYDVG